MTDLAIAPAPSPAAPLSTTLDPGPTGPAAAGGGTPRTLNEEPSLRDSIAAAVQESTIEEKPAEPAKDVDAPKGEAKAEKGAEKPQDAKTPPEAKEAPKVAERGADGKFAGKQAEDADDGGTTVEAKPETRTNGHIEPPAKFLPDAKEKWTNVPRPVQRDVENMAREHEAEVTRYREAADRYEPLRQFDEVARQHGRSGVHESLAEVAQLEDMMVKNPLAALNQILLRSGPRKADGQPYSLFEVAQSVVQMGQQGYHQAVSRQPPANNNADPRIEQLEQRLAQAEERAVAATVIEPFKAAHPRYEELQGHIASFLKSDMIPRSLSPSDRLAAAYDMAERINPPSSVRAPVETDPDPGRRADDTFSGSTSIKSTPGAVTPIDEPDRGGSIHEELQRAVRAQRLR